MRSWSSFHRERRRAFLFLLLVGLLPCVASAHPLDDIARHLGASREEVQLWLSVGKKR